MTVTPYGRQSISAEDIEAVVQVLQSDWLTQGPVVEQFEQALRTYCQAQYAVAVMNATAALHLACLALEVGSGDIVWTTPNTFLASANCARYCGATVDFVDICPQTYNVSVAALAAKLRDAKAKNRLPKVFIPVDFAGQSCDMRAIKTLAEEFGFKIIEDASHAIGGRYLDKPVGASIYADMTVFSFHPVKIMTTGEGGAVVTNQAKLAEKVRLLRAHGMVRNQNWVETQGAWYYEQHELGFNYRITDFQCALGCSQLKRVDEFVKSRNQKAAYYHENLQALPLILPTVMPAAYSAWHLYVIQIDHGATTVRRKALFEYLRSRQILVNVHYIPVHWQPYYQNLGFKVGDFPVAEAYYRQAISLPLYYDLTLAQQNQVIEEIKAAFA